MTEPVDNVSERIAAARGLPEAQGMKVYAEHLAGYDPPFSLAEIANRLRSRKASLAVDRAAREAKTQHAGGKRDHHVPEPRTAAVLAFYSVGDAQETVFLCQIAKAPELAANFIAARTPIVKVREALTQRADQVPGAARQRGSGFKRPQKGRRDPMGQSSREGQRGQRRK